MDKGRIMNDYTYEDLTGLTLKEYAEAMGKSVECLIEDKKKEIAIYARRYDELVKDRHRMDRVILAKEVKAIEHKKRVQLKRFLQWIK